MKTRILPAPDRNIVCAAVDIPILDFYRDYYDSVYVILHPFIKVTALNKIDFNKGNWPTKAQITKHTEKLNWKEFIEISGLGNIKRLDVALRTSIGGLKKQYENKEDAKILEETSNKSKLIAPTEGYFHELLIDDMMSALQHLGHDWIFIGDEFGQERKLEYIQDIIDNKITPEDDMRNWYTHKNEVLYSTHWDSHFTLLCSDRQTINKILDKYPFEGFFCEKDTEIYWSVKNLK